MSEPISYLHNWWRWWGNPLAGIHDTQLLHLPYAREQLKNMSYLLFLELRSALTLPDVPDRCLVSQAELRSLALCSHQQLGELFPQVATLSLGNSILQASAQKWEQHYGVDSAERVRQIIQWRQDIPHAIKPWRESLLITLDQGDAYSMHMQNRTLLGLGAYVQSCFPDFYKRWALTLPYEITLILRSIDPIPEDAQASFQNWLAPMLSELHKLVLASYPNEEIDPIDIDDPDETTTLAQLDSSNPWEAPEDA